MTNFSYTVKDPEGIHARPAGALVKFAKEYTCAISIEKDGKTVDAKKIFGIMGLGVKCGETLTFIFDGADEETAKEAFSKLLPETL